MTKARANSTRFIFQGTDAMEPEQVAERIGEICFKLGIADPKMSYGNDEVYVDFDVTKLSDAFKIQGLLMGMTIADSLGIQGQRLRGLAGPEGNAKPYDKNFKGLNTFAFKLGEKPS